MRSERAMDVQEKVNEIIVLLNLDHIDAHRVICMRSTGSKSNANARIWSVPKIFQKALGMEPHYIIEVISNHFDSMPKEEQEMTLIHELLHIPKRFSGGLVPHECFGKRIDRKIVKKYFDVYRTKKNTSFDEL